MVSEKHFLRQVGTAIDELLGLISSYISLFLDYRGVHLVKNMKILQNMQELGVVSVAYTNEGFVHKYSVDK